MARPGNHGDTLKAISAPLGLILDLPGIILVPWRAVLGGPGLHFEGPGAPHGHFFGCGSDFAENTKIMQKPRFSFGFSMISGAWRASKAMKNLKKSSPECLGTLKNRPGWAGLSGLAAQVANMGQMGGQWTPQWLQQGG